MLKAQNGMKEFEVKGFQAFVDTVTRVPGLKVNALPATPKANSRLYEADFIVEVVHKGRQAHFIGEVKSNGQPRNASDAIAQLKTFIARYEHPAHPVFIAPFLSKETRAMCIEEGVSYIDLAGNARVVFDGVYIEREAADNPFKERREFRSLFTPKAAQVLKVLLRLPSRQWKMAELAAAAGVSLGQVSNVKTALMAQEWASVGEDGLILVNSNTLLDEWRNAYRGVGGSVLHYYTTLHGTQLNHAILHVLENFERPHAALASFSAAEWYAPYARVGHETLYADQEGLDQLTKMLKLSPATKGGNIVITFLHDKMPLFDAEMRGPGLWCTSPIQTYLDLSISGERGREAADFLRKEVVTW
jgi:hypothetical protein